MRTLDQFLDLIYCCSSEPKAVLYTMYTRKTLLFKKKKIKGSSTVPLNLLIQTNAVAVIRKLAATKK